MSHFIYLMAGFLDDWQNIPVVNQHRGQAQPWMAQRPKRQEGVLRQEQHLHGAAYADNARPFSLLIND